MYLCVQQTVQISIPLRTYGQLYLDVSMVWSHYREMQMSFVQRAHGMAEHNMSTHMVISCQRSTAEFARLSKPEVGILIIIE